MKTLQTALAFLTLAAAAPALAADVSNEIRTGPWVPPKPTVAVTSARLPSTPVTTGAVARTKPGAQDQGKSVIVALTTGSVAPTKPGAAGSGR